METIRLKQFCVIAETGSLSKAAELLHITHSGLSKSMKILQDELKISLLRPAGRGIALTEDGMRIYQHAKSFLEMEHLLFHSGSHTTKLTTRIGTVEIFIPLICEHLPSLQVKNQSITLLDLNPGQIEQMVANHELDYGITYTPFPMEQIDIITLGQYQLGCYHLQGYFSNMNINEIPFAVPAVAIPVNPLGIKERDGWIESIIPRKRKYLVNLLSTAIELALQGLCAIFIPKFVAEKINKTLNDNKKLIEKSIPNEININQKIFLIKHKDKHISEQFENLKKLFK
ncbi:LysR family transcriptional regulator [Legionella busanensis]|uniref:LysR family transcriptional regulator n=1 Tax=Legionella busanensis TaxID=190655 RepID=A0A378JMH2_9GAMM|nr:LysR family transcriptional regulator [Legionella busanensis]STX51503.1 LysR family transcriptional regulator [Legionella busanensis]